MLKINSFLNSKIENIVSYTKRKIGGKEIIMEFALGAIAVVLAIVFRDQLESVIETVGEGFSEKITGLFTSIS